jgi:D-alanyl-D-alanine carboxypeptidase
MTGVLGSKQAALGDFVLGALDAVNDALTQSPSNLLNLVQGIVVEKTLNVSASNTLSLSQSATRIHPITPIVGYSGGQGRKVYVKDIDGNQELYLLNQDDQSNFPASTVKLMTALLILERGSLTDGVTLTTADVTPPYTSPSSVGFVAGDTTTYEGLLYGLFLPSGFDACQCAARLIGTEIYVANGSTGTTGMTRFVEAMNARASALGMGNTNFVEVTGKSQISSVQYNVMSAKDAATVAAEVFTHSNARTIASTPSYGLVVGGPSARTITLTNYNRFINGPTNNQQGVSDTRVIGGKNGSWTVDGNHYNLTQIVTTPSGNEVVICVFHAESLYALMLDVRGIMNSMLRDFPYLNDPGYDPADAQWSHVKMLIGGDGSIVDESDVGRTLTATSVTVGDPAIANSTGGLVYNAATDVVTAADAADLEFGSGNACIEVWYAGAGQLTDIEQMFFAKADHTGSPRREWLVEYYSGALRLFVNSTGSGWTNNASAFTVATEEWKTFFNGAPRHIALVKNGSTWDLYIDGEKGTSNVTGVSTADDTNVEVQIGYKYGTGFTALGTYDDFRLTKGAARYTDYMHTIDPRKFARHASADQTASNALSLSQTIACAKTINVSASNTLSLTQRANKVVDGAATSTLTLSQSTTFEKYKNVSGSSALALSHTLSRLLTFNRSMNQAVVLTQLATKKMYFYRAPSNTLALTQSATCTLSKKAANTLTLSQSATYVYSKGAKNAIILTQSVAREMTYLRSLFSNFIPFQTLTREATFRRTVVSTLALTQSATFQLVKNANNVLALSQSATCYVAKPTFSTLVLSDLATNNHTTNVRPTSQLALVQSLIVQKGKAVRAQSILGFNQFARATRVLHAAASNVLALSQALVADYLDESASNALALSQSITVRKIVTVSCGNTLGLTSSVALSKTIVRHVANTLVFKDSFEKRTGIGSFPVVSIPTAQATITKKKCMMVLEYGGQSITLPCPEFNDTEGSVIRLNVKRSMNGIRRVYKRDNPTSQLKYDLVMDRLKAIELRNFILANNSNALKLTNFKGELWLVLLTNSPFSFAEDAYRNSTYGNRSSISLEFEGVRLN